MYECLTAYIPQIKDVEYGKRYPEKQTGNGSLEYPFQMPFIIYNDIVDGLVREVYRFEEEHPEYGLNRYHRILERIGVKWDDEEMTNADVSDMDGQGVMALLLAAIRAERFCDGALLEFLEKGCIQKWLERLAELDGK